MAVNPTTDQHLAELEKSRPLHACAGLECYSCLQARDIVRKLATTLPDTDLATVGEVALHVVGAAYTVILDTIGLGFDWYQATSTGIWAAMDAAATLYRSPAVPDSSDA